MAEPIAESHEDRVERLFDEAAALPPDQRRAFLERATASSDGSPDIELVDEIESLLAADLQAERYFEAASRRLAGTADALTEQVDSIVGERIGPWRVGVQIGRGGMGAVYLAERDDGVFDQTAALKLVRPGLAPDLAERFRAERQILASLGHPGVAQLLGGGVTEDGRPWLAMEYVDGEPITAYCDRHQLGIQDRLRLFVEMCDVVAYAHRNLVVHRDLKPSNVLVAEGARRGQIKLLDFGVAKLLASSGDTPVTASGVRPYTPGYAAPEQILGLAVTTSADVYALGVLLYELLTGRRPHPMSSGTPAVVERAVLESDPTRPSESVQSPARPSSGDTTSVDELASLRGATPQALRRRLQGDLDRIVLKALEREPERRYGSAEALARDVQRHLDGLPVEARPASGWYRLNRFARRHRVGVAAGLLGVFALTVGLGLALWQGRVAAEERDRAEQVALFMTDLLGEFDPSRTGGTLDPVTVLDQAVRRLESRAHQSSDVQAQIYDGVGRIYQNYAQFEEAERLIRRALALRTQLHGPVHLDVAASLSHLAALCAVQGDHAMADSLYQESIGLYERLNARESLEAASSIRGLGLVRRAQGNPAEGVDLVREALAIQQAILAPDAEAVLATQSDLATLLYNMGAYAEADTLFQKVLAEYRETLGAHPQTAQVLSDYAAVLNAEGNSDEAIEAHREALAIRRDVFGDKHPRVAQSLSYLGWALQSQGRADEAEPLYREALEIRRAAFGAEHTSVANSLLMLGESLTLQGNTESGLRLEGAAVRTFRTVLGPDHPSTLSAEIRYATHLVDTGQKETARPLLSRALPKLRDAFGADHEKTLNAEAILASIEG
ncbi:MAG: serine/threonine-protein kinase [Rubricoccaceae bacterium]